MSEHEMVGTIRDHLNTITTHYDMALIPPTRPAIKLPTAPSPDAKIKYAPKGMKEAPAPVNLDALDARRDTTQDLRYWIGFIYDEIRDHNDDHIRTLVDGDNIASMADHISRWAYHVVTQYPDDAENLHRDMRKHAGRLKQLAYPTAREWMPIGDCPITVADDQGNSVVCGAKVRAYPEKQFIECPGCGTNDTLSWWVSQIVPEGSDLAHADAVIACVVSRTLHPLTHEQLRQWASRGFVNRHGKDTKGRTLYSSRAVLAYAQNQTREEVA